MMMTTMTIGSEGTARLTRPEGRLLTLGEWSRIFHRPVWMIRRLFERGFLPEPGRAGFYRVLPESDHDIIQAALRRAGYLPAVDDEETEDGMPLDATAVAS
jgi:hypothetical protein